MKKLRQSLLDFLQKRFNDRENIKKGLKVLLVCVKEDKLYTTGMLTEIGKKYWDQFEERDVTPMFKLYSTVKEGTIYGKYHVSLQLSYRNCKPSEGSRENFTCHDIKQDFTLVERLENRILQYLLK